VTRRLGSCVGPRRESPEGEGPAEARGVSTEPGEGVHPEPPTEPEPADGQPPGNSGTLEV